MREWEEDHIKDNLADLLQSTKCGEIFLACKDILETFCEEDLQKIKAETTPIYQASILYDLAKGKNDAYKAITLALDKTKQDKARDILLEGYRRNNVSPPIPFPGTTPAPRGVQNVEVAAPAPAAAPPGGKKYIVRNDSSADCPMSEVHSIIMKSGSLSLFQEKWSNVARRLGVSPTDIDRLRKMFGNGDLTLDDLIENILLKWVSDKSDTSDLSILCDSLIDTGMRAIAEDLKRRFP